MKSTNIVLSDQQNELRLTLQQYLGVNGLHISGFSDRRIRKMIELNLVSSIPDLYKLKIKDFNKIPGVSKHSKAADLFISLNYSKKTTLDRFIAAIGIPGIGPKKAKLIAKKFPVFGKFVNADRIDLENSNIFTEESIDNILKFFSTDSNIDLIWELKENIGITW